MTPADPHPVLRPAPAQAAVLERDGWLADLAAAIEDGLPHHLALTLPWDGEQVSVPLGRRAAFRGSLAVLSYRQTAAVPIPAVPRTLAKGSVSIDAYGLDVQGLPRAVRLGLAERIHQAKDGDPGLDRVFSLVSAHEVTQNLRRRPARVDSDDERYLQLRLVPLLCAHDTAHRAVLTALAQDWAGTAVELLAAAEAVLSRP